MYLIQEPTLMFGTAYYPEYMPYDRVETDMGMMKQAGMNTLRIGESTWSTLEPEDGVYNYSYIDRVLEAAKRYDMGVIIGTPTYAVPSWLVKKYPDVMVTTKKGREKYGHRQKMDIMNPMFRYHAERIIRKLAGHTAGHSQVIGFQIDNETKHYDTASEQVQALFVDFLKEKFQTTEALNRTFGLAYWSNAIARWEDFPDIRGCVNGGLASEFAAFQRKLAANYLGWQASIVEEYKREDQFITQNLDFEWKKFGAQIAQDGYSYGVQPDMNHYEAARHLTIAGTDIYHPTQDELTGAQTAFCGDAIRCLKGQNYLVLECQAQAFKYWTPYPGQLRLHAYSHLASGAQGILYWNWHSIHNGYETYWKGLLSHDLESNPAYEEACSIGAEWKRLGGKLAHLKKENQVALVVDNRSQNAFQWFPIDKDLSYNDVVRWMYDSLYESNIECDVVDVQALEPEHYRMIVTPALYSIREELLFRLEEFVREGGILVSSFKSFVADEYLSVYPHTQPHVLYRCFGMSYQQFTEPGRTRLGGKQLTCFMELLKADTAEILAAYEHPYWGKYAAITRNRYGKGTAYYIGCYPEKETVKEIYGQALQDAGIVREFPDAAWPMVVRSGRNQEGRSIHYLMNYSEQEHRILCPYEKATDILSARRFQKHEEIRVGAWDLRILEE